MTPEMWAAYDRAEEALPAGWQFYGLEQRGDHFTAVAVSPDGQRTEAESSDPVQALDDLARKLLA